MKRAGATTGRRNAKVVKPKVLVTRNVTYRKSYIDPSESSKRKQINGFALCLSAWYEKQFNQVVLPERIVEYWGKRGIMRNLMTFQAPQLVKWFKFQLCSNFSHVTNQEMPEVSFEFLEIQNLFPSAFRDYIVKLSFRRTRLLRSFWDLMHCKALATTVPKDMILESYQKHHDTMERSSQPMSIEVKERLRNLCREWSSVVKEKYRDHSKIPTQHACFDKKRSEGGIKASLEGNLCHSGIRILPQRSKRIDPIVIHLEGLPKVGKSYNVDALCKQICQIFNFPTKDLSPYVYTRSGTTKHWDGYKGQFITVIDDFGYLTPNASGAENPRTEVITLCSNVDYILPMANLADKGRKFTSEFLILTSNHGTSSAMTTDLMCADAYYRRLSPTWTLNPNGYFTYKQFYLPYEGKTSSLSGVWCTGQNNYVLRDIVNNAMKRWDMASKNTQPWFQTITSGNPGLSLSFPAEPPKGLSRATTYAIPEPLKVRMITKPDAQTYALKPLQLAMFEALKSFPCFKPCWEPLDSLPLLEELLSPDKFLLSGDYTSATDDLSFEASQTCLDVLVEEFKGHPFLPGYISWEGGTHLIDYPGWTGLEPVIQANGQLMGSLLSFPLLCIINAFTLSEATGKSLKEIPGYIHGDDIAAVLSLEEYQKWKASAKSVGLSLSVGKNYLSKEFVSIDSQLFYHDSGKLTKLQTGKFKLACDAGDFQCFRKALAQRFRKSQLVRFNKASLTRTPQSLDIAVEYGGLGDENVKEFSFLDKAIYYYLKSRSNKVKNPLDNIFIVPKQVANRLGLIKVDLPLEDEHIADDDVLRDMKSWLYKLRKDQKLIDKIERLNPLVQGPLMFKKAVIRCDDYSHNELQQLADAMSMSNHHTNLLKKSIPEINRYDIPHPMPLQVPSPLSRLETPIKLVRNSLNPIKRLLPKFKQTDDLTEVYRLYKRGYTIAM